MSTATCKPEMKFGPYNSESKANEVITTMTLLKKDLANDTVTTMDMWTFEEHGRWYCVSTPFEEHYKNNPVDAVKHLLLWWLIDPNLRSLERFERVMDFILENWKDVFQPFCKMVHRNASMSVQLSGKMPTSPIEVEIIFLHGPLPLNRQSNVN